METLAIKIMIGLVSIWLVYSLLAKLSTILSTTLAVALGGL